METLDLILDAIADDGGMFFGLMAVVAGGVTLFLLFSVLRGRNSVRRRAAAEDTPTDGVKTSRSGSASARKSLNHLASYVERTFATGSEKESRVLRRDLVQAGFYEARAVQIYFASRLGMAIVLGLAGLLILPMLFTDMAPSATWVWAAMLGLVGYLSPSFYLKRRIKKRTTQHRTGFPDFMDLMVVCAEAGLSMEAAVDRIAREMVEGHPSLAENLYMTSLEIRAGKSLAEALERMGERLGLDEASMLGTLLAQSAELGTSLSQSLRVYSDEMRNKRMTRAEEKAYALPAKLVVPLTLFVFPVLIVTLMLPAIIRVMGTL